MQKRHSYLLITLFLLFSACSDDDEAAPAITIDAENFSTTIEENPNTGQVIGTIDASTNQGNLTYSLQNESPAGALALDASTGTITVADPTLFVFADNPQISAEALISNGDINTTASIAITVLEEGTEPAPSPETTLWIGENTTFTKADGANPESASNQDRLTDNVWITRGNGGGQIYNAVVEAASDKTASPQDTEWAQGSIEDYESLNFQPFRAAVGDPKDVVGKRLVLHLITDDIYLSVRFTSWSQGRAGGFAYERSTDAAVSIP